MFFVLSAAKQTKEMSSAHVKHNVGGPNEAHQAMCCGLETFPLVANCVTIGATDWFPMPSENLGRQAVHVHSHESFRDDAFTRQTRQPSRAHSHLRARI